MIKWLAVDNHYELTDVRSGVVFAMIGRCSSNYSGVQYHWSGDHFYRIVAGNKYSAKHPQRRNLKALCNSIVKIVARELGLEINRPGKNGGQEDD